MVYNSLALLKIPNIYVIFKKNFTMSIAYFVKYLLFVLFTMNFDRLDYSYQSEFPHFKYSL